MNPGIRIAVDIGGTFTDGVLQTEHQLFSAKIPTTPDAPERAFVDILDQLLAQSALPPGRVDGIIHGTTLATNALIERTGARTALITTAGFRDSLEIGYESRYDQYDLQLQKTAPLIPRERRLVVKERVLANGRVDTALCEQDVLVAAETLRDQGVESIAIGLLHAYANPTHEQRVAAILRDALPDVSLSLSSEVCPEIREYERFSTTAADAFIKPMIDRYLGRLALALSDRGFGCPLFLVTSSGGMVGFEQARERPICLVESGPSGGATLAELTAQRLDDRRVLSYDMGGTTAKICLIDDFRSSTSRQFETARSARFIKGSGLPLRIPVTEMIEIGAGGGSIAGLDSLNRLQLGPRSAGSTPGPACYDKGGDQPTVTDADLLLGRLDPDQFADGNLPLSRDNAELALQALGVVSENAKQTAAAIVTVVDENMAAAARVHGVEHGADLRDYTLVAFGGAGPLHAASIARRLGIRRIAVPNHPGVGSAAGFLSMPISAELSRSQRMTLDHLDRDGMKATLQSLARECSEIVSAAAPGIRQRCEQSALMRYAGQGHEIDVALPDDLDDPRFTERLALAYRNHYRRLYASDLDDGVIEIMTFTVRVSTDRWQPAEPSGRTTDGRHPEAIGAREVTNPLGKREQTMIYRRGDLVAGVQLSGPALILEAQTTTVVPSGFTLSVDAFDHLLLTDERPAVEASASTDIALQVQWNRLQSLVDELAAILMRTAFSPIVRESGDLSVGAFDYEGRMLTQAVTGTPGHVNTMAAACTLFFAHFPRETMRPGDLYLTNDPWQGAGHLNDFVMLKPCFYQGNLIGFISCTSHLVDIGGRCLGPDGLDVFDEGLYIPHMKAIDRGVLNETLVTLLKANSRSPLQAEGDLHALIACCEKGESRLSEIMASSGANDLTLVSERILQSSERAVRDRINALADGETRYAMTVDGYEEPITIEATLTITADQLKLDFHRSAPPSIHGINVPLNYTVAYSVFGLKCAIAPDIPNNQGSLMPFEVSAAAGSILNAAKPAPVCSRHILGQLLPDVALGCLAEVLPDVVPAEGAATLWDIPLKGVNLTSGELFTQELVFNGGTGARPSSDGLSATAFPSGVMGSLVEVTESSTPILIRQRELRPDSGGSGRYRGGDGQFIRIEAPNEIQLTVYGTVDRVIHPARGRQGGQAGAAGRFEHSAGTEFLGKGTCTLKPGESLLLCTPGGGGFSESEQEQVK